jgi:hypothetical protein
MSPLLHSSTRKGTKGGEGRQIRAGCFYSSYPEDEGVDGLSWLRHRGKGLLEVQVQNRGCRRR